MRPAIKNPLSVAIAFSILSSMAFFSSSSEAASNSYDGRLFLQVEDRGQLWYINPQDQKRYHLGQAASAFDTLKSLAITINAKDLSKIPTGMLALPGPDSDQDGLSDELEKTLGTDPASPDTDKDSYPDKLELQNNYDPSGKGRLAIDRKISASHSGQIVSAESGKFWYIEPRSLKKYFFYDAASAWKTATSFAVGATNSLVNRFVPSAAKTATANTNITNITTDAAPTSDAKSQLAKLSEMILAGDDSRVDSVAVPEYVTQIRYTIKKLDSEGRKKFSGIISGATLQSETALQTAYSSNVYFPLNGSDVKVSIILKKQPDGRWLITSL